MFTRTPDRKEIVTRLEAQRSLGTPLLYFEDLEKRAGLGKGKKTYTAEEYTRLVFLHRKRCLIRSK